MEFYVSLSWVCLSIEFPQGRFFFQTKRKSRLDEPWYRAERRLPSREKDVGGERNELDSDVSAVMISQYTILWQIILDNWSIIKVISIWFE